MTLLCDGGERYTGTYFDDGWVTAPVYWRPDLRSGDVVTGPAVVEEFGSTVPLHPRFTATVDRFGNLVVRKVS